MIRGISNPGVSISSPANAMGFSSVLDLLPWGRFSFA